MNWGTTQAGSTMVELISMMTLAGFAMASVAPALSSLEGAAFEAKIDGAISAVHSANYQAHASWLLASAQHRNASHVQMENIDIAMIQGWIDSTNIAIAAGIDCANYGCYYSQDVVTFTATTEPEEYTPCFLYSVQNHKYNVSTRLTWNINTQLCD